MADDVDLEALRADRETSTVGVQWGRTNSGHANKRKMPLFDAVQRKLNDSEPRKQTREYSV